MRTRIITRRIICTLMALIIVLSCNVFAASAIVSASNDVPTSAIGQADAINTTTTFTSSCESPAESVQEILSDFNIKNLKLAMSQSNAPTTFQSSSASENLASIRHETVNKLSDLGYSVYEVTSNTYDNVEKALNTDLSSLGLQKGASYIVVVGGDKTDGSQARQSTSTSYSYTYDGKQYTLRTLTVTGTDSASYIQASAVDLLTKHSDTIIENMLNAIVAAYAEAAGVPKIIGTIASITGLNAVHFTSSDTSTAIYNGGSSWTRVFTQVWDDNYNQWVSGSSVESVTQLCYISGVKYDSSKNQCVPYSSLNKTVVTNSENYNNAKWRNDNAIVAFRGSFPRIHDPSGDAYYLYDSKIIITHRDGFL